MLGINAQQKHRGRAFKPIDTLSQSQVPTFPGGCNSIVCMMVNEREPPRNSGHHRETKSNSLEQPQDAGQDDLIFGLSTPLRNPLHASSSNVFNIPKHNKSRPEHHRRVLPQSLSSSQVDCGKPSTYPQAASQRLSSSSDVVEIPRPSNAPIPTVYPASRPLFSTAQHSQPINSFRPVNSARIDLKARDDDDYFNPNLVDNGGSFDPSNFMDATKANENIKALLEGAFDDEDDKPRTRSRKKKQESNTTELDCQFGKLSVDGQSKAGPDVEETKEQEEEKEDKEYDDEDDGSVEGLNMRLLPHQIDGLAWMIDKEIGSRKKNGILPHGGILADDMGLGKTIQALGLILSNRRPSSDDLAENPKIKKKIPDDTSKSTLVVAPLALIKQWESEINSKVDTFPKLKVLVHHGPSRAKSSNDLRKYDIVITTYQTLTSEHEASAVNDDLKMGCMGVHWYRVILDEAHSIKNRNAKMTKAAYALGSVYRWCLTGTPIQNNLDELQSLICFLRIKPYNDIRAWKEQITQPMKNGRGGLAMKRLQYFLKAFMKRRTKDVLNKEGALNIGRHGQNSNEKPQKAFKVVERNIETVVVNLNKQERKFYDNLAARASLNLKEIMNAEKHNYIGALVLLLRLRQSCNHPQLSRGNLKKENESLSTPDLRRIESGASSPRKAESTDMDDVADLFGALTVQIQKCDTCGSKLEKYEIDAGASRCSDCEEDFKNLDLDPVLESESQKHKLAKKAERRGQHVRRIVDSDDEDEPNECSPVGSASVAQGRLHGGETMKGRLPTPTSKKSDDEDSPDEESASQSDTSFESERGSPSTSTKIRQLLEILKKESSTHKFIVFSEFTTMLDLTEPCLRHEGFKFARYDGKMKIDEREASLHRLRNDPKTRILLCSLRCGSLGLNLTAASRVVIMEPFWNPFVEEQAIDRVHRLNQTVDVTVYRLTVADSVEERIIELQEKKRQLAKAAIDGGKAIGKLNMQDIMNLFKRDAEHYFHQDDLGGSSDLGHGRPAGGIVDAHRSKVLRPGPEGSKASPSKQANTLKNNIARPKFQIPASLRSEYDNANAYARRW